jgi:hypothetical protein
MKLHFDRVTDAFYLRLRDATIVESEEIQPGVILGLMKMGSSWRSRYLA